MFTGHSKPAKVSKADFSDRVDALRLGLINAQYDLKHADFPVIVIVAGDDRMAASELMNRLNEWMDSRFLDTHVFGELTEEESERPRFWRLWQSMPRKGRIAFWVGGLMRQVQAYLDGQVGAEQLDLWTENLCELQRELVADGALVLKFYIHTPAKKQKKRFKKAVKTDTAWRYDPNDWAIMDSMSEGLPIIEKVLHETTTRGAPWQVIQGGSKRARDLTVAEAIRSAIEYRLETGAGSAVALPRESFSNARNALSDVDLSTSFSKPDYHAELEHLQGELNSLSIEARRKGVSTVLAFEGWDAGGKGGAIRRVTAGLEAGDYRVIPVAAPTPEETKYHYLWRFWRDLPRDGQVTVFDRTWYGRVLVERVEGFCSDAAWQSAYSEIVNFEEQITMHGTYLGKFWLHISQEEQLARFQSREDTPYKKHKITDEDYRNRERWDEYEIAVNEMIARTSTPTAPWTVVPANDKYTSRLTVLRTVTDGLRKAIKKV
jgi:polyphosphate:AMP phosphotransferase